jgi:hypothetical protein
MRETDAIQHQEQAVVGAGGFALRGGFYGSPEDAARAVRSGIPDRRRRRVCRSSTDDAAAATVLLEEGAPGIWQRRRRRPAGQRGLPAPESIAAAAPRPALARPMLAGELRSRLMTEIRASTSEAKRTG